MSACAAYTPVYQSIPPIIIMFFTFQWPSVSSWLCESRYHMTKRIKNKIALISPKKSLRRQKHTTGYVLFGSCISVTLRLLSLSLWLLCRQPACSKIQIHSFLLVVLFPFTNMVWPRIIIWKHWNIYAVWYIKASLQK